MKSAVAASLFFTTLAFAETINVSVGPGLRYSPDEVTAAEGDIVRFEFGSGHNVVQGSFDSPCQPISGGIYSGNPDDGQVFSVRINSTDPVWIYCSITGHCEGGMAMVINAPSNGNTLSAYISAARNANSITPESEVSGGTFGEVSEDSSSSASAASTSASAASTSAAAATSSAASSSAAALSSSASQISESAASNLATATTSEGAGSTTSAGTTTSSTGNAAVGNLVTPLSLIAGTVVGAIALVL